MQEDAALKMDELLNPFEVSNELKKIGEPIPNLVVSGRDDENGNHA